MTFRVCAAAAALVVVAAGCGAHGGGTDAVTSLPRAVTSLPRAVTSIPRAVTTPAGCTSDGEGKAGRPRVPRLVRLDKLSVDRAIQCIEAAGWRAQIAITYGDYVANGWLSVPRGAPNTFYGTYLVDAATNGDRRQEVSPDWGTVVCGDELDSRSVLHVYLGRERKDCPALVAPRSFVLPLGRGALVVTSAGYAGLTYVRAGQQPVELSAVDLRAGTCGRPAPGQLPTLVLFDDLNTSTWAYRLRPGLCVTHHGSHLLGVEKIGPARDDTRARRRAGTTVTVTLRWRSPGSTVDDHAEATVQPEQGGKLTRVDVVSNGLNGSSDVSAHVGKGTCARFEGPEFRFALSSGNVDGADMSGGVDVTAPFADVVSTPYVLEIHPETDSSSVIACGRLDG